MVEKQTGKLNDFSNEVTLYSDDEVKISVWKKNRKKTCVDCGKPIFRRARRCPQCNGKIFGGRNKKIIDEKKFREMWMNPKYTYDDIAKVFRVCTNTVGRWGKKFDLPQRRKLLNNHKKPHHKNRPKGLKYNKGDKN